MGALLSLFKLTCHFIFDATVTVSRFSVVILLYPVRIIWWPFGALLSALVWPLRTIWTFSISISSDLEGLIAWVAYSVFLGLTAAVVSAFIAELLIPESGTYGPSNSDREAFADRLAVDDPRRQSESSFGPYDPTPPPSDDDSDSTSWSYEVPRLFPPRSLRQSTVGKFGSGPMAGRTILEEDSE